MHFSHIRHLRKAPPAGYAPKTRQGYLENTFCPCFSSFFCAIMPIAIKNWRIIMPQNYLFIQAVGLIGTVLFFLSYQCKRTKTLFQVQFLSYMFYTAHFLLLGAVTGGISYVLNTVRSFCLGSKHAFLKGKAMCCIICVFQLLTLFFTWDSWWSVFPIVANIAATIGGYTYNGRTIRVVGMFVNSPLWIVYNIIVGSWAGILDEIVTEASMILSIWRYGWKNLDVVER